MGFNGVRKHQKIEDPRYLYWADRVGLVVWEEMPSAYRFTNDSVDRLIREWSEVIARDYSHPCIIAWVPINESWGVPNLPDNPSERHYVQALYHLTRTLDSTRPVIGNDGWESVATDIIGIHDYDDRPDRIAKRYRADEVLPRLFKRERPGGRILVLEGQQHADQPLMLTEFGGIAFSRDRRRHVGLLALQLAGGIRAPLPRAPGHRPRAAGAFGILLHAVRRHVSGSQRTAVCRPHAENSHPRNRRRDARARCRPNQRSSSSCCQPTTGERSSRHAQAPADQA